MTPKKLLVVTFLIILAIFLILSLIRFGVGGNEDTRIKDSNTWVKHGNPSTPMPE